MNAPDLHEWHPDPQLLAAYFDGEMEGRDDVADLRARLEAWLEQHPEAQARWADHQALLSHWQETTPREPSAMVWNHLLDQIDAERRKPAAPAARVLRRKIGAIAAGIVVLLGLGYGAWHYADQPGLQDNASAKAPRGPSLVDEDEVFPVATAGEIVVTYIEGADTRAIAGSHLPVHGPLELAEVGDVRFIAVRSDAEPNLRPEVRHDGPNRPMVWMPLQTD